MVDFKSFAHFTLYSFNLSFFLGVHGHEHFYILGMGVQKSVAKKKGGDQYMKHAYIWLLNFLYFGHLLLLSHFKLQKSFKKFSISKPYFGYHL